LLIKLDNMPNGNVAVNINKTITLKYSNLPDNYIGNLDRFNTNPAIFKQKRYKLKALVLKDMKNGAYTTKVRYNDKWYKMGEFIEEETEDIKHYVYKNLIFLVYINVPPKQ